MKFGTLQENLRKALWKRIEDGELTGLRLAQQTGFKQAHISNLLNRKRGLSLEGMDKALSAQHLSVLDLIDPAEINKRASIFPPSDDEFDNVAVVDSQVAASEAVIKSMHVKDILKMKRSFLTSLRMAAEAGRTAWERFVMIKADAQQGVSMHPRITPGAVLLLDRHYNTLIPYRRGEKNMYAVRKDGVCNIKYVELVNNCLILRPHNPAGPIEVITLRQREKPGDHIVGRVCYVEIET